MKRINDFLNHLIHPFLGNRNQYNTQKHNLLYPINVIIWIVLIPIKLLEIIGFSYLLNFTFKSLSKTRRLTSYEIRELKSIFKDSINYSAIRINESSNWAKIGSKTTKTDHLGFVWMQTINFTRPISSESKTSDMAWLIHEMVHISQFKTLGIQYIFEALIAQHIGGYNYGGIEELKKLHPLKFYNLEQQADIIKHSYLNRKKSTDLYKIHLSNLISKEF